MSSCIGCNCTDDHACAGGCHWVSTNPPVCSSCVSLFDEAEFSGPAFENVIGARNDPYDGQLIEGLPFNDNGEPCLHEKRLYVAGDTFKCCGCQTMFRDEAA